MSRTPQPGVNLLPTPQASRDDIDVSEFQHNQYAQVNAEYTLALVSPPRYNSQSGDDDDDDNDDAEDARKHAEKMAALMKKRKNCQRELEAAKLIAEIEEIELQTDELHTKSKSRPAQQKSKLSNQNKKGHTYGNVTMSEDSTVIRGDVGKGQADVSHTYGDLKAGESSFLVDGNTSEKGLRILAERRETITRKIDMVVTPSKHYGKQQGRTFKKEFEVQK